MFAVFDELIISKVILDKLFEKYESLRDPWFDNISFSINKFELIIKGFDKLKSKFWIGTISFWSIW